MSGIRNMLIAAAAAATLGACAPATEQAEVGSPESNTTLVVENNNWADVVLYVVRGANRARIGSVGSMQTARFKISNTLIGSFGEVRIMADPIGSNRTFTSPVINVVPGSQVELRVENQISISNFSVFN